MTDRYSNQPMDSGRGRGSGRQGGGGGGGRGRGGRSYYHPPYPSDEQPDREPERGPKKKFHGNRSYDATEENEGPGSGGGRGRGGRGGHHHHPKPKFSDRKHDPHLIPDPINAPSIFADVTDNSLPAPSIVGRGSSGAKHVTTPPPAPPAVNTNTSTVTPIVAELVQQSKPSAAPSSHKEKDKEVVPNKKMHKLIFRKLPATQTYTAERFNDHLTALLRRLNLPESVFRLDHFSPGKLSRKRGPIFSTAYVTVLEEEHHDSLLTRVPSQVSFIEDDGNSNVGQPEIGVAPYNKSFRFKEKTDKYVNTYEEDPIFQAFKQRIENPESALSARPDGTPGNVTLAPPPPQPAQSLEDKLKTNSLLNFLREKAAKKLSLKKAKKEKKLGKEKDKLGGTTILTKRDKEEKERERKERRKKKRKAKKAKEAAGLTGVIAESEGGGITGGGSGASVTNASKKKRSRKKKDKMKEGAVSGEDRLVEGEIGGVGGGGGGGGGGDAPKKITILKKEKVVLAGGGGGGGGDGGSVTSTVSDAFPLSAGAAPSTAKLSRREKSRLKREQHANVTASTSSDYVAEGGGIDYQDQRNDVIPSDPYYSHSGSGGGRGGGGGYQGRGGGGGGGRWKRNYHY